MHDPFIKSVFADRRMAEILIRGLVPEWADEIHFTTLREEPTQHAAALDVADQILLLSGCSWEGCLGGPSSHWARPAAFLFWGLEAADRRPDGQRIPIDRHDDAPPLP